ncbi:MAG: hypothetical protein AAFP90_18805 [Planctomycetota bacterium]
MPDGLEVRSRRTDPTRADTDGDGLSDGTEILETRTDPLLADTDGGGDGTGRRGATDKSMFDGFDDHVAVVCKDVGISNGTDDIVLHLRINAADGDR